MMLKVKKGESRFERKRIIAYLGQNTKNPLFVGHEKHSKQKNQKYEINHIQNTQ